MIALRNAARAIIVAPLLLALTGCPKVSITAASSGYPASNGQPGNFATYGVSFYEDPTLDFGIEYAPTPNDTADIFAQAMRNDQWSHVAAGRATRLNEWGVTAPIFKNSFGSSDVVWFSGHGSDGQLQFAGAQMSLYPPDQQCWGPGHLAQDGSCRNISPVTGRTKWIFAYSSDSTSAPGSQWPQNPEATADWRPAFGGSLHGIYGFWQPPGSCQQPFDSTRKCDIKKELGPDFAKKLVQLLIEQQPQNKTVHAAWVMAAGTLGQFGNWSIWEDQFAKNDYITSGTTSSPSGWIYYYNTLKSNGVQVGHVNVGNETFTLSSLSLRAEPVDDNTLLNQLQPYYGSPSVYTNDGVTTVARKDNAFAQHYLATGATAFYGDMQYNAVTFDQTTALNTALTAITNGQGLPSDAVLTEVDNMYQTSADDGSSIQTGYQFVWKHSSSAFGNDAIRVIVDDYQYMRNTTCAEYDYTSPDPPLKPMRYCATWNQVPVDNPNVSFMYRLWRSTGSSRQVQSVAGPSSGTSTSIDANTASMSLPPGTSVISYAPGYWTGNAADPGNVGTPAWVFQLSGGGEAYVDATSGQYLGMLF